MSINDGSCLFPDDELFQNINIIGYFQYALFLQNKVAGQTVLQCLIPLNNKSNYLFISIYFSFHLEKHQTIEL